MMARAKDDLTGAALVSLMRLSFAGQGIVVPGAAPPPKPNTPHASLASKTAVAEWVLDRHGPQALLKVGEAVPRMAFEPIGAALLAAKDGPDMIARWSRLERYVHTRHPIEVREVTVTSAVLAHLGDPDDPPSAAVDLVLAGVIAGLLKMVGCASLLLTMGEGESAVDVIVDGEVLDLMPRLPHPTGLWQLGWRVKEAAPDLSVPPLLDQPDKPLGRLSREVARLIEQDLVAIPSLERLSRTLGQSARTLQRRLAADNLSLQAIRRAAQIRQASAMLIEGRVSLSAIGFICGFTDAAHFARAFVKATGMTPKAFRQATVRA